ncbi:kinase domain-containing protein [Purpureocillium lavendulum]|uniref:Kinase domain-containing protein n=1 Tax=Purpureocillium lavendulum TaxID=1247861 RepID=A0AB34FRT6_9HYPO|nr:kinase domain-containing protein [Purpureocillium lavendulum]
MERGRQWLAANGTRRIGRIAKMLPSLLLIVALGTVGLTAPAPAPTPAETPYAVLVNAVAHVQAPEPTPAARAVRERGVGDDVKSYVDGLISDVGSKVSSFVNSGILDFPNGFPTGSQVEKSAGVSKTDLDAQPTQVLNLPAYANWTNQGWNVRVHGNVYKVPNISQSKIDDLANVFLIDTSVDKLSATEQTQARNVTRSIFVVQQGDDKVTIDFVNDVSVRPNATGGAVNAQGGAQTVDLPYNTTVEGDFDVFLKLRNTTGPKGGHLVPGNETSRIQTLNMYANGTNSGNATAYLVPPTGMTVISDIDDILRVTKIYQPKEGLLNTFARPFTPWMNMPAVYANWSSSVDNMHFHYLTTTPEQVTRNYMEFIYKTYPLGSFDTRPLNFSDLSATLQIRRFLLDKIFQTFPQRKFILVADTSNSDVMKAYPALYKDYPGQVQCIFLRNTSSTDSGDKFPYDTSGFKGIPQERYMFFKVPDDLSRLDIVNGNCLNNTVAQNVTFKEQGLPFGLGQGSGAGHPASIPSISAVAAALVAAAIGAALM